MEKMKPLSYKEKSEFKEVMKNETTFLLSGLERGFGNTLGVALRRVILSNITTLAPFCVRIDGAEHEFTTVKDVVEDVPTIIMNLRKVRFTYKPEFVGENEIVKVKLQSNEAGIVTSSLMEINNPGIKVINPNIQIAETSKPNALKLEMYLRAGRGYMSFDENKTYIDETNVKSKLQTLTDITSGKSEFIAVDSDFSPAEKVKYSVRELNSSSPKIEEELEFTVVTDGTITAKDAIKEGSKILIGMFQEIGNVDKMEEVKIFEEPKVEEPQQVEDDLDITQLGLSVRSLNALRKSGKRKISQIAAMKLEELESTKNLGRKSIDEIIEKLREHGYELKEGGE
ncbi:DNA-directed RNA polymerase subunit alpha [Mycoplasmopsis edwardii]|uniref:DNA-directed RNA polymerase subunit alpha n=2 Tax=Mycoplasmopsis edwardii TaxID=53558 RepID=A0A3B0PJ86_9BACT|nr:DNA-directed RNA polymerase subunit alpha [Mycoplasmopsis edwardii]WBP84062.1 DNA-directed RNA polymerase subunit alpha [Mycoplasmopsis edwardii]SYV96679.1 DNA-directed RNA polymerase subunit alpha [Mycoplasmopsis edwardii]